MAEVKEKKEGKPLETGQISVHTENIFPIIKKSLYSDSEIFLRELVSNAIDASQKMQHLASIGKYDGDLGDMSVVVELDKEAKTLTIKDQGIGMSADEVRKYINQVAFSGAEEFVKKFKGMKDEQEIIGQFGLGFYSAFMVADTVEIITNSYKKNAGGVRWICDGSTEYTLEKYPRKERGTDIILHIAEDSEEFLDEARIKHILDKYCKFLPFKIEFQGEQINDPDPIWNKAPNSLEDQDYLDFYKKLYPYAEDPLFWIHLNVDYPFELTGILYFPRLKRDFELRKDRIHLYSRQVFITDNVEQIVPDYLSLLQGVIDSPDIPLNVSRSYLQGDSNVRKISNYITKKVADKLSELYNEDRGKFEEKWTDMETFVKYGMLSDDKFSDKAKDFVLLKSVDGKFYNIEELREATKDSQTDKNETLVWLYTHNPEEQHSFVKAAQNKGYVILEMGGPVDSHWMNQLEGKEEKLNFKRVDADSVEKLIEKDEVQPSLLSEEQEKEIVEVYKEAVEQPTWTVSAEALGADALPVVITRPEFMRRMRDMAAMGMMSGMDHMPDAIEVKVNTSHELSEKLLSKKTADARKRIASQMLDLALLGQGMLKGEKLTHFIERSVDIVKKK